jgi:hypothetical protein
MVGMMILAAFSVGVFVGHQGLLVGTLGNFGARPVADQPPAQASAVPTPNLPAVRPALIGSVGGVTNEGLFVRTAQGPRQVQVDDETRVRDRQGRELALSDLQLGVQVAIYGEFSEDGRTLTAQVILLLAPAQR